MTIKEARTKAGLTQQAMADKFEIPKRTIENWEAGIRKCPVYVEKLLLEKLEEISMKNVVNKSGKGIDFEAAVNMMDDEIREELHANGFDDEQSFFSAYEEAHEQKFGEEWELSKSNPVW